MFMEPYVLGTQSWSVPFLVTLYVLSHAMLCLSVFRCACPSVHVSLCLSLLRCARRCETVPDKVELCWP